MKRLLIRADDLGFSEAVNYGIYKTVKDGIIRTVGLMTNMPSSEQGYNLIRDYNLCLGQHTNICVGKLLTYPDRIPSLVGSDGEFKPSSEYREAKVDFVNLDEVILEIEAQYQRFVEITGRQPDYFEGHAVKSDNFFKGLEIVAERHGLSYLPFVVDSPIHFRSSTLYIYMDSMKPDYDPISSLKNCLEYAHEDGVEMFVCHPGYLDAYILNKSSLTIPRVQEVEMLCAEKTKQYLSEQEVQLVTYCDL